MKEMKEIKLPSGSIWVTTDDPDVSYAIREVNGQEQILNVGTFEQIKDWLISLGNKAIGVRIQPNPPSEEV